jgi:hypothetical protein
MPALMIALLVAFSSPAVAASAYTHCNASEIIVYSCSTGSHTLSICELENLSNDENRGGLAAGRAVEKGDRRPLRWRTVRRCLPSEGQPIISLGPDNRAYLPGS